MAKQLLYVSERQGNVFAAVQRLGMFGVEVVSPDDLGITSDVKMRRSGRNLMERVRLQVLSYGDKLAGMTEQVGEMVVMADDTVFEINALGGEPGMQQEVWKDGVNPMTDAEIEVYCLERTQQLPPEGRSGRFQTVVGLSASPIAEGKRPVVEYFTGTLSGVIAFEAKEAARVEGEPFSALFYLPQWDQMWGEVLQMPEDERRQYQTHWDMAIEQALGRIVEVCEI